MPAKPHRLIEGALLLALAAGGCRSGVVEEQAVPALRLSAAPAMASSNALVGRVVSLSGEPLADARVICWRDDPKHAQTLVVNAMGYFRSQPLAEGRWHARAEHPRFAPGQCVEFVVGGAQPLPLVLFVLRPGG